MCEFCSFPNQRGSNFERDAFHSDFAGFFSADAIEAAVRQAKANKVTSKKKTNEARKQQGGGDDNDEEESSGDANADDDGT